MKQVQLRWLGVAGLEIITDGLALLVDPYLSRVPLRQMWRGKVAPDHIILQRHLPRADWILVTHAHFDHLLDVPAIARRTGAIVFGSPNAVELASLESVPRRQLRIVSPPEALDLGPFRVEALPSEHVWLPGLRPGSIPDHLKPPLRARDYRMDTYLSYRITVAGCRLLTDPGRLPGNAPPANVLFVKPAQKKRYFQTLLDSVRPRVVIPIHWDDFSRALNSGRVRPLLARLQLIRLSRLVAELAPHVSVHHLEMLKPVSLHEILDGAALSPSEVGCG